MSAPTLQIAGELSDGVVTVRHWRDEDVPEMVRACQDPEIPRWTMVPEPYGERDAHAFLARVRRETAAGTMTAFAVVDAGAGELLASVGATEVDHGHRIAALGYWCAAWARGRGVTTRAVRLVSRWLFDEVGMRRLEIHVRPANEASQRVAASAGYTREGVMRSYRDMKDGRADLVMWSLLPEDARIGHVLPKVGE